MVIKAKAELLVIIISNPVPVLGSQFINSCLGNKVLYQMQTHLMVTTSSTTSLIAEAQKVDIHIKKI